MPAPLEGDGFAPRAPLSLFSFDRLPAVLTWLLQLLERPPPTQVSFSPPGLASLLQLTLEPRLATVSFRAPWLVVQLSVPRVRPTPGPSWLAASGARLRALLHEQQPFQQPHARRLVSERQPSRLLLLLAAVCLRLFIGPQVFVVAQAIAVCQVQLV